MQSREISTLCLSGIIPSGGFGFSLSKVLSHDDDDDDDDDP